MIPSIFGVLIRFKQLDSIPSVFSEVGRKADPESSPASRLAQANSSHSSNSVVSPVSDPWSDRSDVT